MRILIIGAGFAGLSCAYYLSQRKFKVTVVEKESYPGGLAAGFKNPNWSWYLERAYHHLFTSDIHAQKLLREIGMKDKLFFRRPITASLYTQRLASELASLDKRNSQGAQLDAKIYQLDSPFSLLSFPLLPLTDRLRMAAVLSYLKLTPFWRHFEKTTAYLWLKHFMGERTWKIIWQPLFIGKFGPYSHKVNMAWFWARIKKRSIKLGYIAGGFHAFAEAIAKRVKEYGGNIIYNTSVDRIWHDKGKWQVKISNIKYDMVISTLPTPIFIKITPQLPKSYIKQLQSIKHLHALNLVLELDKPFLPQNFRIDHGSTPRPYWLNICNPSWPFLAVVEHTNFVEPKYYGGSHIVYIGNYLKKGHPFFKKSKEEVLNIFLPYLAKINPQILTSRISLLTSHLFTGPFAQPVTTINYSKIRPEFETPLPNLYLANLDSVYPWDRGTNYAIELGENVAKLVSKS